MTAQQFFDKYNNKGVDFDGYYGFQCVDLADQYADEVVGHKLPGVGGAKDFWDHTIEGYDKITNTPTGVPQKGDIIIWGSGVGQYGHIAIFDHGDSNSFVSFDQNWPLNSLCHFQNHNYNGVLGWFHPKANIPPPVVSPQPIIPTITDQTIIPVGINPKTSTNFTSELQALRSTLFDLENQRDSLANQLTILQNVKLSPVQQAIVGVLKTFGL